MKRVYFIMILCFNSNLVFSQNNIQESNEKIETSTETLNHKIDSLSSELIALKEKIEQIYMLLSPKKDTNIVNTWTNSFLQLPVITSIDNQDSIYLDQKNSSFFNSKSRLPEYERFKRQENINKTVEHSTIFFRFIVFT